MLNFFPNINGTIRTLEGDLCDWTEFGFRKYEGNIELLGAEEWKTGHAIEVYLSKSNFMRHSEIQGGRKYYKKYGKEMRHALTFKSKFQSYADLNLHNVAKKVTLNAKHVHIYSHGQELFYKFVSNFTNKLVKTRVLNL